LEEHGSSRSTRSSRLARLARQSRTRRVESSRAKWNLSLSGAIANNLALVMKLSILFRRPTSKLVSKFLRGNNSHERTLISAAAL